jgi:hypothetical protein
MAAGAKLFPAAPDSKLPGVLKALHLQRTSCHQAGRAPRGGEGGQIDTGGTLFPKHFVVEWE